MAIRLTDNIELFNEFDRSRNASIDPTTLTSGSSITVWWLCALGHSWQNTVKKRFLGQSCPYCLGKKAWKGFNDLQTLYPALADEWDYERNPLPIYSFRPMSNKKVWWKCKLGHSWEAVIAKRVKGHSCPACCGKVIIPSFNSLSITHPALLTEWDYERNTGIIPDQVSKGSEQKVWWRCKYGHTWNAAIYSRTSGVGCPQCTAALHTSYPEKAIYFYIKYAFPDAIAGYHHEELNDYTLDIYLPAHRIGIEYDGERWHQQADKDLKKNMLCSEKGIRLIRMREPQCPPLFDNLSINIILPTKKSGLNEAVASVFDILRKLIPDIQEPDIDVERDNILILECMELSEMRKPLIFAFPNLEAEWDYNKNGALLPSQVSQGSDKRVWWICPKGHSYSAAISARTRGRGCSICTGKVVQKGYNDFESHCPELLLEWDYSKNTILPSAIAYGSDKVVWWLCKEGHSFRSSINNRRAGNSCPYCSGKRVLSGYNDIATTHPSIARQWCHELNEILPTTVTAGSHKRVWWECDKCKYRWQTAIYNRCQNGSGCPHCSRKHSATKRTVPRRSSR